MGKVKTYKVVPCDRSDVKEFIEEWHYSKSINGLKIGYCFKLMDGDTMIGAMIYGKLAMGVWNKYVDEKEDLIELRRLCCIDDTPKNTESYFIGGTLRWLKKNTHIRRVISYADATYGHSGAIYKASNFKYYGMTAKGRVIMYNGKKYHDKTIRTKYRGVLKPYALKVKNALESGEAKYVKTLGKHIYLYDF